MTKNTDDSQLFQFGERPATVHVVGLKRFGQAEARCTSLTLGVRVEDITAKPLGVIFGASEDEVLRALWAIEELQQGAPAHLVNRRLLALETITSSATFTDRHNFKLGLLPSQRTHLVKGFHVEPQAGMVATVSFKVVLQSPSTNFLAGFADLLRDPVPVQLLQDPQLPLADIRDEVGKHGGDGQGGLDV